MSTNPVWHKPPSRASPGSSRPLRAVRYTWAGPFQTQLYDDQLNDLSSRTRDSLNRLAGEMMIQGEPCDQYGIKHFHAQSPPARKPKGTRERPSSAGSWTNTSVMFTNATSLDAIAQPAEDTGSITSGASRSSTNFCYLCSTLEEHQRSHHLKLRVSVPVNKDGSVRQKKQRIQYIAPPPRTRRKEAEPVVVQEALYRVTVWTGDVPGAGTDASVYITIVGDQDILNKTRLWRRQGTTNFCFVRGSKEVFHLKGPMLGNLSMITLEHDGLEKRHGWYVQRVEVQCMRTHRVWVFLCKNWLSMHHGDFRIRRDLEATEREHVNREFEVTVETGKKRLAGTDANVCITLHGTEGNSRRHHLNALNRGKSFQRGQTDKFKIRMADIGEIRSMRIEHDGQGMASGWFLSKVTLQDVHNPNIIYYFVYNGWIAKDIGDGLLWREIRAKRRLPREITSGKPIQYEVIVKTGDVRYAGTDANVYIVFVGADGKSTKLFMDDSSNNFERDMTESFKLKAMNVGHLKSIIIGHDNSGPGAGWFCEYVKVRKHLTSQEIKERLNEQKKAWRSHRKRQPRRQASRDKIKDKVKDKDTSSSESSSDEDENDTVRSRKGSKTKRDERFADVFDRDGKAVKFPVYEEYVFPCAKWFAADEADGLLERELQYEKQTLYFLEW